MQSFEWVDAKSVAEAASLLAATSAQAPVVAKAGGLDLLDLMKERIVRPSRVVNLKSISSLGERTLDNSGLRLGTLVTLAQIERDAGIRSHYRALAEAASHAATPQVRNAATIGGNLLQRSRCWYFRNEHFHQVAEADHSEHQYHAIFDNSETVMVHASTPATALVAYDASVHLTRSDGSSQSVLLSEFLLPPSMQRDRDTAIADGEVLTHVSVPAITAGTRCAYFKQTERDSYDWPICDVAVVLQMSGDTIAAAKIVLGWVAPTPRRALASEELLVGRRVDESLASAAAAAAVRSATPLAKNAYKVDVLAAVIKRTILTAR
ncbi:FAD binding domain-containing protein [Steroidobacter sp.]|uniref:FAD binding domain-containing protein n=1 Tax=Steroidobacter sp. TaxID=1978227 RepID=UPI001A4FDD2E|nr:FAD binding domain-containing protein [Steroidobacter sp.]MBL8271850.1 FAD binding domain-containing protein [Steroidobacter sp.]